MKVLTKFTDDAKSLWQQIDAFVEKNVGYISNTNGFTLLSDVVRDLFQVHKINLKNAYRENNILTAINPISIRGIAQESGHTATRPISCEGVVDIQLKNNAYELGSYLIIQKGAQLKSDYNSFIYTVDKNYYITLTANQKIQVKCIEGLIKTKVITNFETKKLAVIRLDDQSPIDYTKIKVLINGEYWTQYDSFYDMGTDTKGFIIRNGFINQIDIMFGDGVNGMLVDYNVIPIVEYMTTNGENANIPSNSDIRTFTFIDGIVDQNGNNIDLSVEYADVVLSYGFDLGSNGENIEKTRQLTGYTSRSNVFARPENLKAYISRFSVIGYCDVWFDLKDYSIMKLLVTQKVGDKVSRDVNKYYDLSVSDIVLNDSQKTSLLLNIENSKQSFIGNELYFVDPIIKKYALHVFLDLKNNNNTINKDNIKSNVLLHVAQFMLNNTFTNNIIDNNNNKTIVKNNLETKIIEGIENVTACSINILSELNETAMNKGYYVKEYIVESAGITSIKTEQITLTGNENPNLGLSDINDIVVNKNEIPLLKPIYVNVNDTDYVLNDAVCVFIKNVNNNNWIML